MTAPARGAASAWNHALLTVLVTGAAMLLPLVLGQYRLVQVTLWAIFGLLGLGLNFVWGQTGIFSFGQTAFFGLAGYAFGVIGINLLPHTGETVTALAGATAFGGVSAALLGYFMFYGRVSEVYVGIITLAVTLVLMIFFGSTADPHYAVGAARLGGYNGMTGIPPLTLPWPGGAAHRLQITGLYEVSVLLAGAAYLTVIATIRSREGHILAAVRENEQRAELLGYDTRWHKLVAFTIGGLLSGLAGGLYAAWGLFINPEPFSLVQSALVVIWVLVGGRGVMAGSFLGVILVEGLATTLGGMTAHTTLILGLILMGVVLLVPNGLMPAAAQGVRKLRARLHRPSTEAEAVRAVPVPAGSGAPSPVAAPAAPEAADRVPSPQSLGTGARLEVRSLGVVFDGLRALDGVSADFSNRLQCIIGPNGAGKSTLFKLLVGLYRPTEGRIILNGQDITDLESSRRARLGIGIKMQTASIYGQLSVRENVWLAATASAPGAALAERRTAETLRTVGLESQAARPAGSLSHGEKQWLEIGMVLAAQPRLILLDEPTAGMTREETLHTVQLVRTMARQASVIVVEHDMEFVRRLAAPVTVLHQGRIFRQGALDDIHNDEAVLDIYLGRRVHA